VAQNCLKQKWASGQPSYGAWLSIPSSFSAEAVAHQGFDYVCIDLQHGMADYAAAAEMLLAIHSADAVPIVRVPSNDFAAINRMLDAGALGIIVPMILSADDTRAAVQACRYPPQGTRSFGPTRAAFAAGPDYFDTANEAVLCIPMIETPQALEELDEILSVPGIDAVYVGPNDLSLALGSGPGPDNPGPYQQAYRRIAKTCEARGVVAGIHANATLAAKHVEAGYRMITVSSDLGAMVRATASDLRKVRAESVE
jgi:4-hydroxy-2-oxoheptanedioate aldolase